MTAIEDAINGDAFDHNDIRIKLFNILCSDTKKAFTLDEICERLPPEDRKAYTKDRIRRTFSILYRLELATFDFVTASYKLNESNNSNVLRSRLYPKQQL